MNQMNGFRLYWRYIRMNFLSGLQYKGWPLMILQTFFVVVTDPLSTLSFFCFGVLRIRSDRGEWSGFY